MENRGSEPVRKPRRDQQTNFMLTKDEKDQLMRFVERRMTSVSDACRYLILKGLETENGE